VERQILRLILAVTACLLGIGWVLGGLALFAACAPAALPTPVLTPTQPPPPPVPTLTPTPAPEWGIAFAALMVSPEEVSAPDRPTRLYLIRPDGSNLEQLTGDIEYLAGMKASPDGRYLLFVAEREDTTGNHVADYFDLSHLYVVDVQSGDILTLTSGTATDEWPGSASWSPDGRQIAFASSDVNAPCAPCVCHGENCTPEVTEYHPHLYVMNLDGTGKRRLTPWEGEIKAVAWSPTGEWIAFEQIGVIWAIRPDGSEWHKVANASVEYWPPYHTRPFTWLAWSPDGSRIAFAAPGVNGTADIFIANPDGSGLSNLTHHPADDLQPAWSPDGQSIAFISNRRGNWAIYTMDVEGGGIREIFHSPDAQAVHPVWSPSGSQIAFTAGPELWKMHLFVIHLSGGHPHQLSEVLVMDPPAWILLSAR